MSAIATVETPRRPRTCVAQRVLGEQLALMCKLTTSPLFATIIAGLMFSWLTLARTMASQRARQRGIALLTVTFCSLACGARLSHSTAAGHEFAALALRDAGARAALAGAVWSIPGSFMLPSEREKEIVVTILIIGRHCVRRRLTHGTGSPLPMRRC